MLLHGDGVRAGVCAGAAECEGDGYVVADLFERAGERAGVGDHAGGEGSVFGLGVGGAGGGVVWADLLVSVEV